ncbi:di-heme oxidoredictase family protein [Variovorax sp. J31P207]|uniref:di-heme oxidoreductase family protein n=1 Tax=Variovorax sp. J31P207 TaxID=3053510 RepID=UPI0025770E84|nr:di-heme oxidoredictase family protein [Variovorax sp. J31P207]MDM0065062.1 di-heme oxidoredictase family protein [Variovorax sp. J31P207]
MDKKNIDTKRLLLRAPFALAGLITAGAVLSACGGGAGSSAFPAGGGTPPPVAATPTQALPTDSAPEEPRNIGTDVDTQNPVPPSPRLPPTLPMTVDASLGVASFYPLFAASTPVTEQIQYRETDGTLVTLMGMRPTERHARERGEPWTAPDEGPGRYLTFPSAYFQNRTYGIEIRDHVPAGKQLVEMTLIVNDGTFDGTTFSLFRNSNDEGVRDYGWSLNTGFNNPRLGGKPVCAAGTRDCQITFDSYWDVPKGQPHRALQLGDVIELSPAQRMERFGDGMHAGEPTADNLKGKAVVDGAGSRYYSFEQLYVVGQGLVPWYGVAPRLNSAPLPEATLLGGSTSLSYNYSEEPMRVFQQMSNNIGIVNAKRFVQGRRLFHTSFLDGRHSEHPDDNPVFAAHVGQLGPRFNQERCIACHTLNGRSAMPGIGARLDSMAVLTAAASSTGPNPVADTTYGLNVQQRSRDAGATDLSVSVQSYAITPYTLPDGEKVELQKPVYAFKGPVPAQFSVRQAAQVVGMGLIEAIDETTILALADPADSDGDGVRGVPNWVTNPENGKVHLGRYGWKAAKATLRQQIGDALLKDMSVTSPVFPSRDCQRLDPGCRNAAGATSISEVELARLTDYLSLLAVPAQRSLRSGFPADTRVSPEHDVNPGQIVRGGALFAQAKCVACHTPQMKTGSKHPFAELRNQTIHPYTNLLLHDMGPGLADTLAEGKATAAMWRTAPLWGLGSLRYVQGTEQSARYLHDGRARTLMEAIVWHGGEAAASRASFEALSKADRAAVLAFLNSL